MNLRPSVSTKIFLGFFGLLVLALGALGTASALWFQQEGLRNLDQFLDGEARGLTNRLEGMLEGLTFGGSRHPADVENILQADLRNFIDQRGNRAVPYKTTLVVLDSRGRILAQSNHALDLLVPPPAAGPGETKIEDIRGPGPAFRVLTGTYSLGAGRWGLYRVACPLSSLELPFLRFMTSLGVLLGGCLVLLTFLGAGLLVQTLKPVRSMARAAGQISEQNLGARIPVPEGNDNLSRLAVTLNGLLGRLEADYAFQERLVEELTHQLKTPLTILRGRNELGLTGEGDLRELVEDNISDIDEVVNLLNTLLELARLDSRIDRLKMVPVDLRGLVEKLEEDLEPLWQSKDLKFLAEGDSLTVDGDPDGLKQILTNLYDNSWKFAPSGSTVSTRWQVVPGGPWIRIVVSNQGPPVPEEDLERIFKRFYQSPGGTGAEDGARGSGLGLSIVRSLAGLQGGRVRAFNPPDGGAAFEVLLPYGSSR